MDPRVKPAGDGMESGTPLGVDPQAPQCTVSPCRRMSRPSRSVSWSTRRPSTAPAAAVTRALAKDPARRFASMAAFAAELRACLAEPLPHPEPTPRASHRTRRNGLPLVAALLALIAAAPVVVVLVLSRRRAEIAPAIVPYAAHEIVERSFDKLAFTRAAQTAGLAVPRTEEADEAALAAWDGPVVVKARLHAPTR